MLFRKSFIIVQTGCNGVGGFDSAYGHAILENFLVQRAFEVRSRPLKFECGHRRIIGVAESGRLRRLKHKDLASSLVHDELPSLAPNMFQ